MTESTKTRVYIKLILTTKSPFSVCSGIDEFSDKDIIKRGDEPFIPGSSLAGVFRNYIKKNGLIDSQGKSIDEIDREFFGYIYRGSKKEEHKARQSSIYFGDAIVIDNECADNSNTDNSKPKYNISFRDGVKLGDRKTAIDTGKYNYEIIEKGAKFKAIIEYCGYKSDVKTFEKIIETIANAINSGELRIGSKISRGLGYMEAEYYTKTFTKANCTDWLEFDPYNLDSKWDHVDQHDTKFYGIEAELEIPYTLLIRDYNIDPSLIKDYPNIEKLDYGQLCSSWINAEVDKNADESKNSTASTNSDASKDNKDQINIAVIPGTTWAGAFRHRTEIILKEILCSMYSNCMESDINAKVDRLTNIAFGQSENQNVAIVQSENKQNTKTDGIQKVNKSKDDKNKKLFCKSNLSFFESEIEIQNPKDKENLECTKIIPMTRTKIDRFTGGSMHGALFSENVCCGGKTILRIGINRKCENAKAVMGMIFLCLDDLNDGLLAIGGETAVGRGIMTINYDKIEIHKDILNEINKDIKSDTKINKKVIETLEEECLKSLAEELRKNECN